MLSNIRQKQRRDIVFQNRIVENISCLMQKSHQQFPSEEFFNLQNGCKDVLKSNGRYSIAMRHWKKEKQKALFLYR